MSAIIKLAVLGALLLISFLLNTVSMFTKGWLYWSIGDGLYYQSGSFGVVPYHKELAFVGVACVLMYLSFALFFVLFLFYAFAGYQTQRSEGSPMTFFAISLISSHITLMTLISVVLIAVDTNQVKNMLSAEVGSYKISVGYSAWLALCSGLMCFAVSVLSLLLARGTDND